MSLKEEYDELNESHLRGRMLSNKCKIRSFTLFGKVEVEWNHKHNVLRFNGVQIIKIVNYLFY
jgi:hypothetical protein